MKRLLTVSVILVFALAGAASAVRAQEQEPVTPPSEPQAQPTAQQVWSPAQLENLVAPVALYPDPLLGQILVASTYPLEVVEASQWLQQNRNLHGRDLVNAAKQQPWDASVQALVAVPDALAKLNQDIRWTTDLGNAFLGQQTDVMNAVQRMRERARENGHLASTPQQTVTEQDQDGQQVIVIQPANPQVIYVPAYDPYYIWGPPVYGYYPPLFYPDYGFGFGIGFNLGFCFDHWGGWGYWGWGPSWFGRSVFVNNYFFNHYGFRDRHGRGYGGRSLWVHDPSHRMNVPYGSARVAERFGGRWASSGNSFRGGSGRWGASRQYNSSSNGRYLGRDMQQGFRGGAPQIRPNQNPQRERYQQRQQYRTGPQVQRPQTQSQQRYQAPQQYRAQQNREAPRVASFGSQSQQRYQSPQQYRTQQYREAPRVRSFGSQGQQVYRAPQQYRESPRVMSFGSQSQQVYRAPQVQRFQSQPQMRMQAPQQFRSAPTMSAPRFSSGAGFNRGGSSGFSRGGGGSSTRGGGGSSSRGEGRRR